MTDRAIPADSGDLQDCPFPLLLARLYKTKAIGTLAVMAGPFRKRIYLREGCVVFSASDDANDRLGEMLLRRGILTLPAFHEASREVVPGKRFGTILVEKGLLSAGQLVWAVTEQVKEIVFSLFGLSAGAFNLSKAMEAEEELITLSINTPELLRQGVGRMDTITAVLNAFPDSAEEFALTGTVEETVSLFKLEEMERDVVARLGEPLPLSGLCTDAKLSPFDLVKFLWVLLILGLMAPRAREAPPESSPEEFPDLGVTGDDLTDLISNT